MPSGMPLSYPVPPSLARTDTSRLRSRYWRITERLTGAAAKMRTNMSTVHAFADAIIDARVAQLEGKRAECKESAGRDDDKDDLLALYMRARGSDGEKLTKAQLRCAAVLLVARASRR